MYLYEYSQRNEDCNIEEKTYVTYEGRTDA